MTKREKNIGIVMVAIFLIWFFQRLSGPGPDKKRGFSRPGPARSDQQGVPGSSSDGGDLFELLDRSFVQNPVELERDPFLRIDPNSQKINAPLEFSDLVLSGIIEREGQTMALINGHIVGEGDMFSRFVVREIRTEEVVLTRGIERFVLRLFASDP